MGKMTVCVYVCACVRWTEAVMPVSFSNGTDRWSRFGRKAVLISPSLQGEMGQSGQDNLQSLAGKLLERKIFFTLSAGTGLFCVDKLTD